MQALILAAGMGKRLKNLTKEHTKCMVKVNGITLIERVLNQLDSLNLSKIVLVIGYKGKYLKEFIQTLDISTSIEFVENDIYDKTNNIYSLFLAKDYLLNEDTLLLESDCIIDSGAFNQLLNNNYPSLALVSKYQSWMDGTVVDIDENCNIRQFIDKHHFKFSDINHYYKTVNIYKLSKEFSISHYVPFLIAYVKALGNNEYYEQVLKVITLLDKPEIKALILDPKYNWYEIDDIQDLNIAESIFANTPEEMNQKIQRRYGGFWRYPKLIDFCYLVNPFYPPKVMIDELQANFTTLLTNYPSGQAVNNLLVAKNFGVRRDQIIVGNGAAELIKVVMENLEGNVGCIFPSFEEYVNRIKRGNVISFVPNNDSFSYNSSDLINYYEDKNINTLILVNPDNPSGNFIEYDDLIKLINWCESKSINLILDESFVDFAQKAKTYSLIDEELLDKYNNLLVIKSISKSYGVSGLRLGIAATSNESIMNLLTSNVSIWNINSFGEYYLQIEEKYHSDYLIGLDLFRKERERFFKELSKISYLKPIKSEANYIMCQLVDKYTAKELTEKLLSEYNLIIKDLSKKKGFDGKEYIRLAVRNSYDNNIIEKALKDII